MDHPLPWLRFVDAGDIENEGLKLDGLKVESELGESLGSVKGFIVDAGSTRPLYVVIDSGGWFKSKHFLLPVGHAELDDERDLLVADVTRERIDRFPGFDLDTFGKLSEADVKRMNDEICSASSLVVLTYSASEPYSAAWDRPDFEEPDWWNAEPARPNPMGIDEGTKRSSPRQKDADLRHNDSSPHYDGRAQPGDVIGVETGGERTYVGDTADDKNKRRRDAEEAVAVQAGKSRK